MITISNSDRDQAADFLREYAAMLKRHPSRSPRHENRSRLALVLAKKLERKQPHSDGTTINININTSPSKPHR